MFVAEFTTPNFMGSDALNISHRKEEKFAKSYLALAIEKGEITKVIDARIYYLNQLSVSCCLWYYGKDSSGKKFSGNGSGKTTGYGYEKISSAISEAIESCSVTLNEEIAGVGESNVILALKAFSRLLGYEKVQIFEAFG